MIGLNFSNMMEDVIGAEGLSERIIENFSGRIEEAHKKIKDRITPELAFIDLHSQDTSEIKNTARHIREISENFLILGIGGSALGPRAILEAMSPFHNLQKKPRVFIYDNVDPRTLKHILSLLDLKTTSVNVISKSGSTAETAASLIKMTIELTHHDAICHTPAKHDLINVREISLMVQREPISQILRRPAF
jgi:glucose-6-phosphate isomerase